MYSSFRSQIASSSGDCTWGAGWGPLLFCSGVALYLYANLFVFPNVPILLSGDQVYFWTDGLRMLHGEQPYRDFFQLVPPGTDLLYFAIFKLLGPRIWVTNVVVLALGVALCWLCFSIARQMMQITLALLATLLFLTLVYTRLLNATHHWFSMLAILCAIRIVLQKQSRGRMLAAGTLLGLGCFFTQSHGLAAMLGFAMLLGWQHWYGILGRRALLVKGGLLLLGFVVTLGALHSYFIATMGWKHLWYFQVTYVTHFKVHGPETDFFGMPDWREWRHLPGASQYLLVYLLLPIVYACTLARYWVAKDEVPPAERSAAMLLVLTGILLLCEVAFSLNWLRLYAVSMPAFILLLLLIGEAGKLRRVALGSICVGIALIAITQIFLVHHRRYVVAKFPSGWAAAVPGSYRKLHWIEEHTRPEEFFFQAGWPGVYLPLQLRNPVFLDVVGTTATTRPAFVRQSIEQLEEKQPHYIMWPRRFDLQGDLESPSSSLSPLRAYLRQRYRRVWVFDDQDEIWERE